MKVRELIELLQRQNQEAEAAVPLNDDGDLSRQIEIYAGMADVRIGDIDGWSIEEKIPKYVTLETPIVLLRPSAWKWGAP